MLDRVRWEVRRMWQRFRGLSGSFTLPEDSERARTTTEGWDSAWPESQPQGHLLRDQYPDQWVRFHGLPNGKRYAEAPDEHREVLHRHTTVLDWLAASSRDHDLLVIAEDWGPEDIYGGWSRRTLPDAWPWRVVIGDDEDISDQPPHNTYFWVTSITTTRDVQHLLELAADDRAFFLVCDTRARWIYAPYDGGADVILPNTATREALKTMHPAWLPDRADGL